MVFLKTIKKSDLTGQQIKSLFEKFYVIHVKNNQKESDDYWFEQAQQIGLPIIMDEDKTTGNKTGNFWIDIQYNTDFPMNFVHSNTRQPLHTDGSYEANSPNISFFHCIQNASIGGATTFIDLETIKKCLEIENPKLLSELKHTPVKFKKGNDFKISTIFYEDKCNWNYFRAEKCSIVEEFHRYLENRVLQMGILKQVILKPGEALFFRDEYVLHGRNAFIGNRWLKKGGIQWIKK